MKIYYFHGKFTKIIIFLNPSKILCSSIKSAKLGVLFCDDNADEGGGNEGNMLAQYLKVNWNSSLKGW